MPYEEPRRLGARNFKSVIQQTEDSPKRALPVELLEATEPNPNNIPQIAKISRGHFNRDGKRQPAYNSSGMAVHVIHTKNGDTITYYEKMEKRQLGQMVGGGLVGNITGLTRM